MPIISIIIPAYNVAPFIGETLESVFAQTFSDFEVIVVNDGSPDTDKFERALGPFLERITYLKQENGGASVARNTGLLAAGGEFVAFLDADDVWMTDYLCEQVRFMREQDYDLVCADATIFGDTGDTGRTFMETFMPWAPLSGKVSFVDLLSAKRCLITSGVVARRSLVLETGLFDETLRNAQDYDLWLRLAHRGARLGYHRKVLLRYRCHTDSLTGDAANQVIRELRILDKVEKSYKLTVTENAEICPVIRKRKATLQFELGKLLIARGDVGGARAAFGQACSAGRSWKIQLAVWLSRFAPGPMHSVYRRRLQRANAG